jgi:hypothetical protein
MRRQGKKRKLKPYILIVCEGQTEEIYFKSIKEDIEKSDYTFEVIVKETDKTTAVELVELAQSQISRDDNDAQYWAVFDKNGYTKHAEAFEISKKRGNEIHIGFSSISFEHWVLLHYEKNGTPFLTSKDIMDYLYSSDFYPEYKKATVIYHNLKDKIDRAMENAAWLRHKMEYELKQNGGEIYKVNPYTNIDKLVSILIGYNQEIIWGRMGKFTPIEGLCIKIEESEERQNDLILRIVMKNNHKSHTHIENNESKNFYLTDNKKRRFDSTIEETVIIANNETKNFELIFPKLDGSNDTILNFKFKRYVLLVKLEC